MITYQINDSDIRDAGLLVGGRSSKLPAPDPRPVCKLVGKPKDKWVVIDEVVRSLCRVGRERDAGLFGAWGNDSDVSFMEVLTEATRLCQVH